METERVMDVRKETRLRSLASLADLGYEVAGHLPLLELDMSVRQTNAAIAKRLLALHGIVGVAFGWAERHQPVSKWFEREQLWDAMTGAEIEFVKNNAGETAIFQGKLEGLFGLAWAAGLLDGSILSEVPGTFVNMFPKVLKGDSTLPLRNKIAPRAIDELIEGLDLLYCLDSAMLSRRLRNISVDGSPLHPFAVQERRRALEWLFADVDWDDVELDT